MLQQMQSSFVFVFDCELQLVQQRWIVELKAEKKGSRITRLPRLKDGGLEVKFRNQLHYARIVGEGLCRIVEGTAVNTDKTSDTGISD